MKRELFPNFLRSLLNKTRVLKSTIFVVVVVVERPHYYITRVTVKKVCIKFIGHNVSYYKYNNNNNMYKMRYYTRIKLLLRV